MNLFRKIFRAIIISLLLAFPSAGRAAAVPGQIVYVKWNAAGANNGTSWANAYTSLQTALTASVSGYELWVAAGTYKPSTTDNREHTFSLKTGVSLYGGFAGTESIFTQRNPKANITRLSGDIGTARDWADNSYHVVTCSGTDSTAVLDGFSILYGNANAAYPHSRGGGIRNEAGDPTLAYLDISGNWASDSGGGMYNYSSTVHLAHVTFSDNRAKYGGGMGNDMGSPVLQDVVFNTNHATTYGGGIYNNTNSTPSLTDVTFSGNSAGDGGGMMDYSSSPVLVNVTFTNNTTTGNGAGIYNMNNGNPVLTNVTFSGNAADYRGGGMMNLATSSPILTNVTFSGNTAVNAGGAMYNSAITSNPVINNSLFWGNGTEIVNDKGTPEINDSLVQGGCPVGSTCNGNILNANPLLGALAFNGGLTSTRALGAGSPAIDAGNNSTCAASDQRGVARPQDGNLNGTAICDMGAYEYTTKKTYLPFIRR